MNAKSSKGGDEENSSFDLPESVLEELKPGVDYGEPKRADTTDRHGHATEVHDRFARRDRKDVPQGSLADRIRQTLKGGE